MTAPDDPRPAAGGRLLVLNGGASSVKFALYQTGDLARPLLRRTVERPGGNPLDELTAGELTGVVAVGHRLVHGGARHFGPAVVTPELLADLRAAVPLDPNHLPAELKLIDTVAAALPGVPQVACFDTAFHRDLPAVARTLPLPRRLAAAGVRRDGFHGISFSYLLEELGRVAGSAAAGGRVILAHLGAGASLAAVRDGRCVDTTMGLTPAGGLVMATRSGDLDPGVLVHLLRTEAPTADALDRLVTRDSGLLGVSETSGDVRELLAVRAADPRAAEALDLFCYSVRKHVGALAAALGGLDTLVFSGGIGEHSPWVRQAVCDPLVFLGVRLDPAANAANAAVVSAAGPATVRVIPTDEEGTIARAVAQVLRLPQETTDG